MKNRPSVFLSYSHRDVAQTKWVERLAAEMQKLNMDVWYDKGSIPAGVNIRESIEVGLRGSDAVVSIISKDYGAQPNVIFEYGAAIGMGKRLIPVVMQSIDSHDLPLDLSQKRVIVASDPQSTARAVAGAILPAAERKPAIRSQMAVAVG